MRSRNRTSWILPVLVALGLALAGGMSSAADDEPWANGKNWLSVRAGFAQSTVENAPPAGSGVGFGFSHMITPFKVYKWTLFKRFSLGAYVHHEALGKFGSAAEIEVPFTVELDRHFLWKTPLRPYLGVGMGPFYRKLYRTGADFRDIRRGTYLAFGANTPINRRNLLGIDVRFVRVDATNDPTNPVFGLGSGQLHTDATTIERHNATHWSTKINYTLVY